MLVGNRKDLFKVILLVPLAIISTFLALSGAQIISLSSATRLGVHSILVYWAAIPTAVLLKNVERDASIPRILFLDAFLFFIFTQIDHAIMFLRASQEATVVEPVNLIMILLELCLLGVLFLLGAIFQYIPFEFRKKSTVWFMILLFFSIPLIIYSVAYYTVLYVLLVPVDGVYSIILGSISAALFVFLPFIIRGRDDKIQINRGYFGSASFLIALSSLVIMNAYLNDNLLWIFAENLIIASLFLFSAAFVMPYLKELSYKTLTRYLLLISLSLATYLPLLITTIIESLELTFPVESGNFLAFAIIHIGAGTLSAIMAVLLFAYSRLKPSRIHANLVLLFCVWSSVVLTALLSILIFGTIVGGEPTIPYFVGGLLTILIVIRIHKIITEPKEEEELSSPNLLGLFLQSLAFALAITIGEVTNQVVIRVFPVLQINIVGDAFLLVCNYLVFLSLAYLLLLLASTSKGRASFEMYVVGFLAFWIVPATLKSFYSYFTPGWWVSEILLFASLLIGPSILVVLYINASRDVKVSHTRARLYADLLMHDITNYNQMTLTTLELLSNKNQSPEEIERLISDARTAVSLTEQLIENVRLMNESDNWADRPVLPTNLITTVVNALDVVTHSPRRPDTLIRFKPAENRAYVMANELLFGAILNLLYVALEIPTYRREMTVKIQTESVKGTDFWNVTIEIPYQLITPDDISRKIGQSPIGYIESTLGFQVARLIVRQMNGTLATGQLQTDVDRVQVSISMVLPSVAG